MDPAGFLFYAVLIFAVVAVIAFFVINVFGLGTSRPKCSKCESTNIDYNHLPRENKEVSKYIHDHPDGYGSKKRFRS